MLWDTEEMTKTSRCFQKEKRAKGALEITRDKEVLSASSHSPYPRGCKDGGDGRSVDQVKHE